MLKQERVPTVGFGTPKPTAVYSVIKTQKDKKIHTLPNRSPPWRSSAFSRLSIALLQVRLAFLHEVWLLELQKPCEFSLDADRLSVSSSHSSLPAREWWGGYLCVAQSPSPFPPHVLLAAPETVSILLPPTTVPLSPRAARGRRPGQLSLCLQPAMAPLKGNSQTAQLGARGPVQSHLLHITVLPAWLGSAPGELCLVHLCFTSTQDNSYWPISCSINIGSKK